MSIMVVPDLPTRFLRTLGSPLFLLVILLTVSASPSLSQSDPAAEWDSLYPKMRDRLIPKEEARHQLQRLEAALKEQGAKKLSPLQDDRLCFPLEGYDFHSIGGKNGSGYQVGGYDFFDGNRHKGHPGHDIFIHDKNQDSLDDVTGRPVRVIAAAPGIVVSLYSRWELSSTIRGGNYVWIYDPAGSRYYYYAHLGQIFVEVGQLVSRGGGLGTVGRTGLNAYPKRSPTHLHFTVHESLDGYPRPFNPYRELIRGCH
jgi:murein DD-endopeptidase MepM/ murein hydrolase activator NlpD